MARSTVVLLCITFASGRRTRQFEQVPTLTSFSDGHSNASKQISLASWLLAHQPARGLQVGTRHTLPKHQSIRPRSLPGMNAGVASYDDGQGFSISNAWASLWPQSLANEELIHGWKKEKVNTLLSALNDGLPHIVHQELDWKNILAKDVEFESHTGVKLSGMAIPNALERLREVCWRNGVDAHIRVEFLPLYATTFPYLLAEWQIQINGPMTYHLTGGDAQDLSPATIYVETAFRLDDNYRINFVRIDKWLTNGRDSANINGFLRVLENFLTNEQPLESSSVDIDEASDDLESRDDGDEEILTNLN